MARPSKAKQGERQAEALKHIAKFEATKRDWSYQDLAKAMDIHPSQAQQLVGALTLHGKLVVREVLVKKILPTLAA